VTANCRKYRRWLSLELDGALDAPRAGALEHHLEGCPACRAERRLWLGIRDLMREEEAAAVVGDGVLLRVIEVARRRREAVRRSLPLVRVVAAAAAILLLASLGALWFLGADRTAPLAPQASDDLMRFLASEGAGARALVLTGSAAKADAWGDGK
jgi:anti-sigma factor RsiW